jgi:hypothetical protein
VATFGKTDVGANAFPPVANEKRVYITSLPEAGHVTKLSIYDGTSAAWRDATLTSPVFLTPRLRIYVGFHYGGSGLFRLVLFDDTSSAPGAQLIVSPEITIATPSLRYSDPGSGSNQWIDADTYSDGTEDPFGASGASPQIISVYATYNPVRRLGSLGVG